MSWLADVLCAVTLGASLLLIHKFRNEMSDFDFSNCTMTNTNFGRGSIIMSGGVCISDNQLTIGGKKYTLPKHKSVSVRGNKVYLDGKLWTPENNKHPRLEAAAAVTKLFEMDIPTTSEYYVMGAANVSMLPGAVFHVSINITTAGENSLNESMFKKGIDISEMQNVTECAVVFTIPESFKYLKIDQATSLQAVDVKAPLMDIRVESTENVRVKQCHLGDVTCEHNDRVEFEYVTCPIFAGKSGSGDVTLRDCNIETIRASSMSGDVRVVSCAVPVDASISTMSGSVTISGDLNCTASIKTMSGSVSLDNYSGKGGMINTMSGSVNVRQNGTVSGRLSVGTMSGSLSGSGKMDINFATMSGRNSYTKVKG